MLLLVVLALATPGDSIEVDFQSAGSDPKLFRADSDGEGGRWVHGPEGFQGVLAPGPEGRSPIKLIGRFRLEGDFEVEADYQILELPPPSTPAGPAADVVFNALELVIAGPGAWAVVSRKYGLDGSNCSSYAEIGARKVASPTVPAPGDSGRLGVRRVGSQVHFWRAPRDGEPEEIHAVEFGAGPIHEVALQLHALNTLDGLRVRFDRMTIRADGIEREVPGTSAGATAPSPVGSMRRWLVLATVLVAAALIAMSIRRNTGRGGEPGPKPSGFVLAELATALAILATLIALI